jgi:hypothetical protein
MGNYPNLYMSFKISPADSVESTCPLRRGHGIRPEWLAVIRAFPNRFVIGSDHFYGTAERGMNPERGRRMWSEGNQGGGPFKGMGQGGPKKRVGPPSVGPTMRFFSLLPPDLAEKVGRENPFRIFRLNR